MKYPRSIQNLINQFSKLPTVGPKTAERYVFHLLKKSSGELKQFADSILNLKNDIIICKTCLSVTEKNPCHICSDQTRDHSIICVTTNTRDMAAIESTGQYKGVYHVLGGVINAIDGMGPEKLTIRQLIDKIKSTEVKEVLVALNSNMEGETTAMYIAKTLKPLNIKITRLARGLPMGSDLEYADDMTISNALKYRTSI